MFVGICFVFVALSGLQQLVDASTNTNDTYPGPIQEVNTRHGNQSNVPDICKGLNYCTVKPDDYPQELFNKMFKGKFMGPIPQPTNVISEDRSGDPEDMDNCDIKISFDHLYKVKTKQGDWRTVVQAPEENFVQMVRLESCINAGSPCFTEFNIPGDLQPICKQKYNAWEFLVYVGDSGTEKIKVDLPVCCSCYYKNSG